MASVLDLQFDFLTPGDRLKWLLVVELGLSAFLSDSAAALAVLGLVGVAWTQRELLSVFLVSARRMMRWPWFLVQGERGMSFVHCGDGNVP